VPALIRQIEKAKKDNSPNLVGWGTGNATRDFLYVEDAAEGIIRAAESYDENEPLNIATGKEIPVRELMETLCRLLDFKGGIVWDSTKPEGQLRYVLDVSRARDQIGFSAQTDLEEGLSKTVAGLSS
jgi:nucleoside-diphosphate-sugar epimerase